MSPPPLLADEAHAQSDRGTGGFLVYGGSGIDVITAGAGNQTISARSGKICFDDIGTNLKTCRFDRIDNFEDFGVTNLFILTTVQRQTNFIADNCGTAVTTKVGSGTATVFASNADVTTVDAHMYFTF